jgi:hypothetical protein
MFEVEARSSSELGSWRFALLSNNIYIVSVYFRFVTIQPV